MIEADLAWTDVQHARLAHMIGIEVVNTVIPVLAKMLGAQVG